MKSPDMKLSFSFKVFINLNFCNILNPSKVGNTTKTYCVSSFSPKLVRFSHFNGLQNNKILTTTLVVFSIFGKLVTKKQPTAITFSYL